MKKVYIAMLLLTVFAVWIVPAVFAAEYDVKVAEKEGIGKYLTDGKGMTLYIFKRDSENKSSCTGGCIQSWPIFHGADLNVGKGLNKSDFGTITREDGKEQTAYKGMPLYYYIRDSKPGDTTGHGVYDIWFAAEP